MEIRLLVNGNLVHSVTMSDLDLITSKRDIFFSTTAPEFIPKDFALKGVANEQDNGHQESSSNDKHILRSDHGFSFNNSNVLPIPTNAQEHPIHRANSLQKPRSTLDEPKRHLSKSNSCGHTYTTSSGARSPLTLSPNHESAVQLRKTSIGDPGSPETGSGRSNKFHSCRSEHYEATDKVKPLRIFRIPLANLTGAHSHYHSHNRVSRLAVHKIDEESHPPSRLDPNKVDEIRSKTRPAKQISDITGMHHKSISEMTTKESLFSSL